VIPTPPEVAGEAPPSEPPAKPPPCEILPLKLGDALLTRLGELGEALFSVADAATAIGVTPEGLDRFLSQKKRARLAFEQGRLRSLMALRQAQLRLAQSNATMAIFVGRDYFGQGGQREMADEKSAEVAGAADRLKRRIAAIAAAKRRGEN
jgi:hypothetical protein